MYIHDQNAHTVFLAAISHNFGLFNRISSSSFFCVRCVTNIAMLLVWFAAVLIWKIGSDNLQTSPFFACFPWLCCYVSKHVSHDNNMNGKCIEEHHQPSSLWAIGHKNLRLKHLKPRILCDVCKCHWTRSIIFLSDFELSFKETIYNLR